MHLEIKKSRRKFRDFVSTVKNVKVTRTINRSRMEIFVFFVAFDETFTNMIATASENSLRKIRYSVKITENSQKNCLAISIVKTKKKLKFAFFIQKISQNQKIQFFSLKSVFFKKEKSFFNFFSFS